MSEGNIREQSAAVEREEKPRICVTLFHPLVPRGETYLAKPHHGAFIEELAGYVKELRLAVPELRRTPFPKWLYDQDGNLTYNYPLAHPNLEIFSFAFEPSSVWERLRQYRRAFRGVDFVFFFSPSIVSMVAGAFLYLLGKPFFAYVSTDPRRYFSERFEGKIGARALSLVFGALQVWVLKRAKALLVTGAGNQQLFEGSTRAVLVSPLAIPGTLAPPTQNNRSGEGFRFLFVGVITPRKRLLESIALVKALRGKGFDATLTIVGTTDEKFAEYFNEVLSKVNEQPEAMRYVGYVSEPSRLRELYAQHDFLLLLSEFEGFPKVIYEAMAAGAVPVLTRLDSYLDLRDRKNCLFFDGQQADFESKLRELSGEARAAIRAANYSFLADRTQKSAALQLIELFNA